jgi:hypothetical protein
MFTIKEYGGRGHARGYGAGCVVPRAQNGARMQNPIYGREVYVADEGRVLVKDGVATCPVGERLLREKNDAEHR